jgi:flotillin
MAGPLNNVDKITIISTGGDGKGAGANQITADVARMIAQVPELFETLTGVKVGDLLGQITGLQPHGTNGTNGTATTNGAATDGASRKVIEGNATAIQPKSE